MVPTPRPRPSRRARALVAASAAVALLAGLAPFGGAAGAQEAVVIDDPRLDPSLAGVQVDGDGYRRALAASRAADARLSTVEAQLAAVTAEVVAGTAERDRLAAEIAAAEQRRVAARAEVEERGAQLRALAVESYMGGRPDGFDAVLGGAAEATGQVRDEALVTSVTQRRQEQIAAARAVVQESEDTIRVDGELLASTTERLAAAEEAKASVGSEAEALRGSAAEARRTLADWRLAAEVAGTDLPLVALDAYVKASARLAAERPECGIRWWGLAGIGKVESGHGSYGGARLTASGATSQPIIGIPLDGTNGTALITDSDGGGLDGDTTHDRAVGPMQFIPTSWRSLGRDGNGDGRADPGNLYDAALAAATLLCRAGGSGLDGDGGLRRAALGYNASGHYADLVVRHARAYAADEARIIPPPPAPPTVPADPAASPPEVAAPAAPPAPGPPQGGATGP